MYSGTAILLMPGPDAAGAAGAGGACLSSRSLLAFVPVMSISMQVV